MEYAIKYASRSCATSLTDRQLLVQFQSGIVLLYCFWATPPACRTHSFESMDVSDALRACSNIIALLVERWPNAECLQDVFELLAHEIPLTEHAGRTARRVSQDSSDRIQTLLPQLKRIIVHRQTIRTIEEIISEDFPRPAHGSVAWQGSVHDYEAAPAPTAGQSGQVPDYLEGDPFFGLPFEDGGSWISGVPSQFGDGRLHDADFPPLLYPGMFGMGD